MTGPLDKDWLDRQAAVQVDDRTVDLDTLPKCPECGYIIYKLPRMRCPECGNVIRAEDVHCAPLRAELERAVRHDRWKSWIGVGSGLAGAALVVWTTRGARLAFGCFFVPLTIFTVAALACRLYLGDSLPPALLLIGTLWLAVGLLLFFV